MKFRKKPIVVEAIRFDGNRATLHTLENMGMKINEIYYDICCNYENGDILTENILYFTIKTLEGKMTANIGDWIIKDGAGEFYPCKPDIFQKTYDLIETYDGFKLADGMKYTFYKDVTKE